MGPEGRFFLLSHEHVLRKRLSRRWPRSGADDADAGFHGFCRSVSGSFYFSPAPSPGETQERPIHPASNIRTALAIIPFVMNIIIRVFGPQVWLASSQLRLVLGIANGATIACMYGLFVSLNTKNRIFWFSLSFCLGQLLLSLFMPVLARSFPPPVLGPALFYASAACVLIYGLLAFIFITGTIKTGIAIKTQDSIISVGKVKGLPLWLLPLIAAFVVFWTNSFTSRLFMPLFNFPFGSNPTAMAILLLLMPVLGFFADFSIRRYLVIAIPAGAAMFLLSPALLLLTYPNILFFVLYIFSNMAAYVVLFTFPFLVLDIYWNVGGKGYLAYFLAVFLFVLKTSIITQIGLFRDISLDGAYAITLLSLCGILFFALMWKVLKALRADDRLSNLGEFSPTIRKSLKEYNLSERETEIALLVAREGLSNKEIAERLFISPLTVRDHVSSIYRKYEVRNRAGFLVKVNN